MTSSHSEQRRLKAAMRRAEQSRQRDPSLQRSALRRQVSPTLVPLGLAEMANPFKKSRSPVFQGLARARLFRLRG